jgi:hypothetical protein
MPIRTPTLTRDGTCYMKNNYSNPQMHINDLTTYITYKIIMFHYQDAIFRENEIQSFASTNTTILVFK